MSRKKRDLHFIRINASRQAGFPYPAWEELAEMVTKARKSLNRAGLDISGSIIILMAKIYLSKETISCLSMSLNARIAAQKKKFCFAQPMKTLT
jgi:hypothetical protein